MFDSEQDFPKLFRTLDNKNLREDPPRGRGIDEKPRRMK